MSSYKLSFILFVIPLFGGCESVASWIKEKQNAGTTLGFSQCQMHNADTQLSPKTVRNLCLLRHERIINAETDPRAGYKCIFGECFFSGRIENKSTGFVITGIDVSVRHNDNKDEKGNVKSEVISARGLWIEPEDSQEVEFSEQKFQPSEHRLKEGDNFLYSWTLQKIRGLEVKLR